MIKGGTCIAVGILGQFLSGREHGEPNKRSEQPESGGQGPGEASR